ncbi:DNA polymerase beta superfamily protein [Hyalangium versicolor]|uniref:DNA polymerase beta superfamily protein n=1 Tax=Hyalangium versicolor TaxID=2861190 RepID=UPI00359FC195
MSQHRIKGLESVDPLSVPLPHGTEIITRVARVSGERRVPQGMVGRVVRARDGGLDVQIPGVGELWYAREELVPRKPGQVQFALRRAAAWDALHQCAVIEATVGSRAWGLAHEGSDTDLRGVFALPLPWTWGLGEIPRDLVSADGSSTY